MDIWQAVVMGLVQGLTEFLPVSSSGHLLLAGRFLGLGSVPLGFELVCHLGTLIAVCLCMRREIAGVLRHPFEREGKSIVVACLPTAIIAGLISVFWRDALDGSFLIYGFLITGILLLCCGFSVRKQAQKTLLYRHAAIVGAAQGIAALPGLSRSGATMATAMCLGYSREQSARFSFLISIPVIVGSSAVELLLGGGAGGIGVTACIAAFFASFISGTIAVSTLLRLLEKHSLDGFAVYLFALSVFLLLNDYVLHLL